MDQSKIITFDTVTTASAFFFPQKSINIFSLLEMLR